MIKSFLEIACQSKLLCLSAKMSQLTPTEKKQQSTTHSYSKSNKAKKQTQQLQPIEYQLLQV
jgi:hypothetical protein